MIRTLFNFAFVLGLVVVGWVGLGFVTSSWLALAMTAVIGAVYLLGAWELMGFRAATRSLAQALAELPDAIDNITIWIGGLHPSLQNAVRSRIDGERGGLPGPALTPYLVGLLVMLGMLGTFLGMVVTFTGAVLALEGSADLQAIRSALAAPIKGLGLAFGTSVAGVAASATLGLMSAISRRERSDAARQLDSRIATVLRPFSASHQRQETYRALQAQAQTLPDVAERLRAMTESIERRGQQLDAQLLGRQDQFHRDVTVAYTGLASAVGAILQDSLATGARLTGERIAPVVEAAMAEMAQESRRMHERVGAAVQAQLHGLSAQFSATAGSVAESWTAALQKQEHAGETLIGALDQALLAFAKTFDQRSSALLTGVHDAASASLAGQAVADRQRQDAWNHALESMATSLQAEWQRVGSQTLAQQQAVCTTLETTAAEITGRLSAQAGQTIDRVTQLLTSSEQLVRSRIDSDAQWTRQQAERADAMALLLRTELTALRQEEATRGRAAVERLGELQAALASQLATLGAALETPLTRLLQTAAEVPQAASEVIAQLRQEMSRLTERDNQALAERVALVERIGSLLQVISRSSGEQQAAIELLVASAGAALDASGRQLSDVLGAQAGNAREIAAHVSASAVELSSLGESFNQGVQLFSVTNEKLIGSLQRIEGAIGQSMARSDDQLAYYVAQAREVIDLSITAQQGLVEDLRRRDGRRAALPERSI